jgi:hypothetical protein
MSKMKKKKRRRRSKHSTLDHLGPTFRCIHPNSSFTAKIATRSNAHDV